MNQSDRALSHYQNQLEAFTRQLDTLTQLDTRVQWARKVVFGVFVALALLATGSYLPSTWAWILGGASFLTFLALLAGSERIAQSRTVASTRLGIAQAQLAKATRRWAEIPEQSVSVPAAVRATSEDLDLFGHASLFQWLCRAHTPAGRERLRDWLTLPAPGAALQDRQACVQALAPAVGLRDDLDFEGQVLKSSAAGPEQFLGWCEGVAWLAGRPWLIWLARALIVILLLAPTLGILGLLDEPVAVLIALAVLVVNLGLSVFLVGAVHDILERVDSRSRDIAHYTALFAKFEELPHSPHALAAIRAPVCDGDTPANAALAKLARIMRVAQMRHSSVLGILHLGLQLAFLLDFHVLDRLERWKRRHGQHARQWFDALAELEATASLAAVHFEQPSWCFAQVTPAQSRIEATALGHPLLATPVTNDVSLGPTGRFLLVSGSNMSGKSTLMRAIGLNVVLAQAGAPVCASSFALPPLEIATSMRIQDSLEDGISFFMAELKRLKEVVDHAENLARQSAGGGHGRRLLFLLDEILQGTNSAERHIAVGKVVKRLTESGAMGAISTHDLELARSEDLQTICDAVHFRESFSEDDEMTFDYVMREGVATTTNALKLLALVGIE